MSTFVEEIREWLDTETRAILCRESPKKYTAVGTQAYSLLLVLQGNDKPRTEEVVKAIRQHNPVLLVDYPFVMAQEMTLNEALAGQFALALLRLRLSAFVPDGIVCNAGSHYLQQLNDQNDRKPRICV